MDKIKRHFHTAVIIAFTIMLFATTSCAKAKETPSPVNTEAIVGNGPTTEASLSGWEVQAIPAPPGSEENPSLGCPLALDSQNRLHAVYTGDDKLIYACWDGNSWINPVVVDVVADEELQKKMAKIGMEGGAWFHNWQLALDSKDHPHIAYIRSEFQMPWADEPSEVHYSYWNGSKWQHEIVKSYEVNVDNLSLALDANGNPHLSYFWVAGHTEYGGSDSALIYAHRVNGRWKTSTVDDKTIGSEYHQRSAIALDPQGHPHIAYSSGEWLLRPLSFASWNGSAWHTETIDPAAQVDEITFAIDKAGISHIAYHDANGFDLKYAVWNGTNWKLNVLDNSDKVGFNLSLAIAADNSIYIAYQRETIKPGKESDNIQTSIVLARKGSGSWQYSESLASIHYLQGDFTLDTEGKPYFYCFNGGNWYSLAPKEGSWQANPKSQPAAVLDYSDKLVRVALPPEAKTLVDATAPWQVSLPAQKPGWESWRNVTLWSAPASWADISECKMIGELKHDVPYEIIDGRAIWTNMSDISDKQGYDLCLLLHQSDLEGWISVSDLGRPIGYENRNEGNVVELSLPLVLVYFNQPFASLRQGPSEQYGVIKRPDQEAGEPSLGPSVPAGTCYAVVARVDGWLAAGSWSNAWLPLATPGLEPYFLAFVLRYRDSQRYQGDDIEEPICFSFYLPASGDMSRLIYRAETMYNVTRPFADPTLTISYINGSTSTLIPRFLGGTYSFSVYYAYFDASLPASAPRTGITKVTFEAGWGANRFQATMYVWDILKGWNSH